MSPKKNFTEELKHETNNTRKILERLPMEKLSWKPHEKSMNLERLSQHIAELPTWITLTIKQDELDFAKGYTPSPKFNSTEELIEQLNKNVALATKALEETTDEHLLKPWTLRNGEQIFFTMPRAVVIRNMVFNHIIHHRAQLGVYLRLLNVPLPTIYGPTADESVMPKAATAN